MQVRHLVSKGLRTGSGLPVAKPQRFAKTRRIYVIDFVLGAIALVVGIVAILFAPQSSSPALS